MSKLRTTLSCAAHARKRPFSSNGFVKSTVREFAKWLYCGDAKLHHSLSLPLVCLTARMRTWAVRANRE